MTSPSMTAPLARNGARTRTDHDHLLRCPRSGAPLERRDGVLETIDGEHQYRLSPGGIPLFAESFLSPEAAVQQKHYDRVAAQYLRNLGFPHTQEYMRYLDEGFLAELRGDDLGRAAEIC